MSPSIILLELSAPGLSGLTQSNLNICPLPATGTRLCLSGVPDARQVNRVSASWPNHRSSTVYKKKMSEADDIEINQRGLNLSPVGLDKISAEQRTALGVGMGARREALNSAFGKASMEGFLEEVKLSKP